MSSHRVTGDGPLSHSRETRNATSEASGVQRRTNSSHSAASAEREQALARSLTELLKSCHHAGHQFNSSVARQLLVSKLDFPFD